MNVTKALLIGAVRYTKTQITVDTTTVLIDDQQNVVSRMQGGAVSITRADMATLNKRDDGLFTDADVEAAVRAASTTEMRSEEVTRTVSIARPGQDDLVTKTTATEMVAYPVPRFPDVETIIWE